MILQGSFPGGRPHSSVLLEGKNDYLSVMESERTIQTLSRHPNNFVLQQKQARFNRENYPAQCYSSGNKVQAYPINISWLNFGDSGFSMNDDVLQMYEEMFEKDLSDVRIHQGNGQAETVGALAFTAGSDIYFASGRYNPYSRDGLRLLGHELTHVIQQKKGQVNNPFGDLTAIIYDPGLEAEAERYGIKINSLAANRPAIQMQTSNNSIQLMLQVPDYGPVICNATDLITGAVYTGINEYHDVHPNIRRAMKNYVEVESWSILHCAEIGALDSAYRSGANLANLVFSSYRGHLGMPPCRNCSQWLSSDGYGGYRITSVLLNYLG
jgi:hypothetical protein